MPYESCSVNSKETKVFVRNARDNWAVLFAEYSTPEKTKKAMEELKYAYLSHNHLKLDKKVPENVSPNILEGVFGVFQFPKDEELE